MNVDSHVLGGHNCGRHHSCQAPERGSFYCLHNDETAALRVRAWGCTGRPVLATSLFVVVDKTTGYDFDARLKPHSIFTPTHIHDGGASVPPLPFGFHATRGLAAA